MSVAGLSRNVSLLATLMIAVKGLSDPEQARVKSAYVSRPDIHKGAFDIRAAALRFRKRIDLSAAPVHGPVQQIHSGEGKTEDKYRNAHNHCEQSHLLSS